jgi:hypothetical protein
MYFSNFIEMFDNIKQRFQRSDEQNENTIFVDNINHINSNFQNKVTVTVQSFKNNGKILLRYVISNNKCRQNLQSNHQI